MLFCFPISVLFFLFRALSFFVSHKSNKNKRESKAQLTDERNVKLQFVWRYTRQCQVQTKHWLASFCTICFGFFLFFLLLFKKFAWCVAKKHELDFTMENWLGLWKLWLKAYANEALALPKPSSFVSFMTLTTYIGPATIYRLVMEEEEEEERSCVVIGIRK